MGKKVAVIEGDGVGPELTRAALSVMQASGAPVEYIVCPAGAEWWEKHGGNSLIPPESWKAMEGAEACFKGATVTPGGAGSPRSVAVSIRQRFDLYANVRPIRTYPNTPRPLGEADFLCVREATEGLYSGLETRINDDVLIAMRRITRSSCLRVAKFAFAEARKRQWGAVVAIHKSNILKETDGAFLQECHRAAQDYKGIALEEMHVDNCAQQMLKNPQIFNRKVLLSTNLFMDILSEEASALVGSIGLIPAGNYGAKYAMFEPAHGAAPKYKGQDKVNPTASILCGAMLLDYLKFTKQAQAIVEATEKTISDGVVTYDLKGSAKTSQMAETIVKRLRKR
ncbi:MAG: isocitrate/isopropylmalate dehydrogenase family protein [Euryarchaeota archaeon]|nr:isocitrate/isopropylmalate dehydrogenase family protein [Euryarchaeota archaeon]